jgi:hypothetical protein
LFWLFPPVSLTATAPLLTIATSRLPTCHHQEWAKTGTAVDKSKAPAPTKETIFLTIFFTSFLRKIQIKINVGFSADHQKTSLKKDWP